MNPEIPIIDLKCHKCGEAISALGSYSSFGQFSFHDDCGQRIISYIRAGQEQWTELPAGHRPIYDDGDLVATVG